MKVLPTGPGSAPERGMFNKAEKSRLIWLSVAFALVLTVFLVSLRRHNAQVAERARQAAAERAPQFEEQVVTPRVDVARLRALAQDAQPRDRVLIEPDALAAALDTARLLRDAHFEPMGGQLLDGERAMALVAEPDPHRGELYRARGRVASLQSLPPTGSLPERVRGHLELEHGGHAWFVALDVPPAGADVGDFVRLDGLFLEVYRGEADGGPLDAPLLVAPRVVRSYPELGPVPELPENLFMDVQDDSLQGGITGLPHEEYWTLVGHARDLGEGSIDWSKAPVLDRALMARIARGEEAFHGLAVRVPPVQIMDVWEEAQKENPLRIAKLTQGWLGSQEWIDPGVGLAFFASPMPRGELDEKDTVVGRGFFLKNWAYEPAKGGVAIAPFLVLHELEVRPPVDDSTFQLLLYVAGGTFLGLLALIGLMLVRDRRRSAQLQAELLQRKRARRAQRAHP